MNRVLVEATILSFGLSAFFRKLAVDKIHPYHMQIISAGIYLAMVPMWYNLAPKNSTLDLQGTIYAIITTVIHICGAVMFGTLLKSSNSTGALSVMISAAPVITIMLSMSFLDEEFELKHFVATLLTLSGLALFNVK
jgi:uncharacterized membrane protein